MNDFHPLDVVDRGSEKQIQVGVNLQEDNLDLPSMINYD